MVIGVRRKLTTNILNDVTVRRVRRVRAHLTIQSPKKRAACCLLCSFGHTKPQMRSAFSFVRCMRNNNKKIEFNVRPRSNAMRNRKTTVADLMAWRHRRSVDICIKIVDRFEKWRVRNAHIFSSLRVRTLANGMYKSMLLRRVQKEACRTSQNKIAMKECHAMPCYRLNQNIAGEQNNRRNRFSAIFLSWLKPILHGNMSRRMVHWCICKMRSVRAVYILGKVTVQDGHEGVRLMHRRPCGPNRHGSQTLVCPIKMHCLDGSYSYSYICANCRAHAIVVH